MPNTLEISKDLYKALVESFGEETLKEKIDDILLSAIENRLEQYTRQILKLEEKYGVSFKEFEQMWERDKIKNKYSHEVESDFIDWEMLEMEKKDLISALSRLKSFKKR
jgi:acetolactate synthase small subunit